MSALELLLNAGPERWARAGWLWIAVAGILQLVVARWAQPHLHAAATTAAAAATQVALLAGLVLSMTAPETAQLIHYLGLLLFLPGFPLLIALVRAHAFGRALVAFMVPPAPLLWLLKITTGS